MNDHADRSSVPDPRRRRDDDLWFPTIPGPRAAPALERMPARPAPVVPSPRPASPSGVTAPATEPLPVAAASTALAVRPAPVAHTWRDDVVRAVTVLVTSAVSTLVAVYDRLTLRGLPT